ncbi:Detected protein of unknown function [Hibiscus syriacus]|uniref:RING-type E3 ubiquitin transferase n=1 Tax=Hibiscus syriacus TaxID=106335 RepID=A0A6A2Y7D8_HIBSY|nr:Detected protein of unknown function [Hibiscus syriacus]
MDSASAKFHVVLSGNNNSLKTPCPTYQFDLDDAITMPENASVITPFLSHQFDLDEAITMPENTQARQQELAGLVSDMPAVNHAAGSCSVCMESFEKSKGTARRVSCGHVYHHNCITGWLLNGNSNSCPLCRHEISG